MLKKLLDGPLLFTPRDGYYEFEGRTSFVKLVSTAGLPISVASPGGLEPPAYRLGGGRSIH